MAEGSCCYGEKSAKQGKVNLPCFPGSSWLARICLRFYSSSANVEAYALVGCQGPALSRFSVKMTQAVVP